DGLAPLLVRNADHGDVLNPRVGADDALDLGRIDVLAAADDHVALAIHQVIEAVLVASREVAHRAPGAPERLGGALRVVPVAAEGVRRPRVELADLTVRNVLAVRVVQPDRAGPHQLPADR